MPYILKLKTNEHNKALGEKKVSFVTISKQAITSNLTIWTYFDISFLFFVCVYYLELDMSFCPLVSEEQQNH